MLTSSCVVLSLIVASSGLSSAPAMSEPVFAVFADEKTDDGVIKSVDPTANSFILTVSGKDVTLKVDSATKYMLDGKDSTMADALKAGYKSKVTHKDGKASKVDSARVKP